MQCDFSDFARLVLRSTFELEAHLGRFGSLLLKCLDMVSMAEGEIVFLKKPYDRLICLNIIHV